MIIGIGIDITTITRIKGVTERFAERFLYRVFCDEELTYCLEREDPYPCLAARFAMKEAFSKALGTGFRCGISMKHICTINDASGAPEIHLSGKAIEVFRDMGGRNIHVSLGHEGDNAVAMVVLEA